MDDEVVWLKEDRRFAFLVSRDAYYSIVRYTAGGIDYEVQVENDDYDLWEERAIDYESEE